MYLSKTFREPSNGNLVNDKCVFGVDVYIIKNHGVGECLSPLFNETKSYKHEWKISEFTKLKNIVYSQEFTIGGYKWKLRLYPTCDANENGQNISIFLELFHANGFDSRKKVHTTFSISIKDQFGDVDRKLTTSVGYWFAAPNFCWGWAEFLPLSELKDPKKSFIVGDCSIVEADVSVLHIVTGLS
ncbi:MATH domain and coiled-coil domain-containing protein At3g58210-like [Solanum tuberosum]|uniref:MATH domain and coiled-coil domain-containing protein At3g58210-like n=1 Tax=Solanum tuberosum TaxID=4113 RepID=UPI000739FB58|nr:PREDICTED: MATH domain and coiled-coil domain-containing protein At3g58210-like [Solanum tuberosum]